MTTHRRPRAGAMLAAPGLSVCRAARLAGLRPTDVRRWLRGERTVTDEQRHRYEAVVSDWLTSGREVPS